MNAPMEASNIFIISSATDEWDLLPTALGTGRPALAGPTGKVSGEEIRWRDRNASPTLNIGVMELDSVGNRPSTVLKKKRYP